MVPIYQDYIVGGGRYAGYVAPSQPYSYGTYLSAGTTYFVDLDQTTVPLDYTLAGPQGTVLMNAINAGQQVIYTPTVSGSYDLELQTANGAAGSYTFTTGSVGPVSDNKGDLVPGNAYSDNLFPFQVDGYTAMLYAGVTYTFDLTKSSLQLDYALSGPNGAPVVGTINAGQQVSYTPTTTGLYRIGINTYDGELGSYSLTVSANPPPAFTGQDMTTGLPLQGYGSSFSDITTDSLSISTQVSNAFVISGTGGDIIQASGGGTNVLADTGGVVNFEIGSTSGNNAFFLDASKDLVTWNTIDNFHRGDFAVIYGISTQNLLAGAANSLGVPGYSGLTLETYQNGGAAFVTFAGHSKSDLASSLATAFGTDPNGRSFLLVVGT